MQVFISWSGDLSYRVALIFKECLPTLIQAINPYVSSEDIDKGARWFVDVSEQLDSCDYGLVCLTRENMLRPWVLFEVGALSKSLAKSRVSPFLIDIASSDLSGPLVQFQATTPTDSDFLKLLKSMNRELGDNRLDEGLLEKSFEKWWPDIETQIRHAKEACARTAETKPTVRGEREMLEEILELTRSMARNVSTSPSQAQSLLASALTSEQPTPPGWLMASLLPAALAGYLDKKTEDEESSPSDARDKKGNRGMREGA